MKRSYDIVAPFYDRLLRLVFGDAVLQSQIYLINAIKPNSSVLITGGGTGYILEEISKQHLNGLVITYVDFSKKMIDLSKRRNAGSNQVIFINQSITDVAFSQQFDVVITPFFLDNFLDKTLKIIHNKIHGLLKPGGLWLLADFQNKENKFWQKAVLKLMYVFFRLLCNIEATHLEDFTQLFIEKNFKEISANTFYGSFIRAAIYQKQ